MESYFQGIVKPFLNMRHLKRISSIAQFFISFLFFFKVTVMKTRIAKFFLPFVSTAAILALVGVVGCSNVDSPTTSYNDTPASLVAPNYTTTADVFSFGDNSDMYALGDNPTGNSKEDRGNGSVSRERNPRLIIRCLELDSSQRRQLEGFMKSYEECVKAAREAYRSEEEAIRNRTRAAEREIRAQVEAGTMTKDEARAKMKEISTAARTAINAAREAANKAAADCKTQLMASIESILKPGQLEVWKKWLETGIVPCKEKGPRDVRDTIKIRR